MSAVDGRRTGGTGAAPTTVAAGGLVVDAVTVRYGETTVLDELSLSVAPGEVVAVLGPSGSGKSTLLRAVAGLEPLAAGAIRLGGRDLSGVPTHRRGLGLMFQDHGLFTHLDVAGNIAYGLRVAGMAAVRRDRRVAELIGLVGLEGLEGRRVDQLSGGEAQRVALARALAPAPGLLMLDEPLGSLDRALREQLTADLRPLLAELGQTAIHVTHDQSEAFAVADRVAVIRQGRLMAVGRPAELWADPGSVFVAGFLGHPNRLTVTVGDGGVVRAGGVPLGRTGPDHELVEWLAVEGGTEPFEVVLPSAAITVAADPVVDRGVDAVIQRVVFDRGRHRIGARLVAPTAGEGADPVAVPAGVEVEFERIGAMDVGASCRLRFDLSALKPLHRP